MWCIFFLFRLDHCVNISRRFYCKAIKMPSPEKLVCYCLIVTFGITFSNITMEIHRFVLSHAFITSSMTVKHVNREHTNKRNIITLMQGKINILNELFVFDCWIKWQFIGHSYSWHLLLQSNKKKTSLLIFHRPADPWELVHFI